MKTFKQRYPGLTRARILRIARAVARDNRLRWHVGTHAILSNLSRNTHLFPLNLGGGSFGQYIEKWLKKFENGYAQRPSRRKGAPSGTIADELIDLIIGARLPNLLDEDVAKIRGAHRLSMAAENLAGDLLEEYLAGALARHGWFCCWGETVKSVDFCDQHGHLLQAKNRSNTENSSSRLVREGTSIEFWYRIDARTGESNWQALHDLVGERVGSETRFHQFVKRTIESNPAVLFVDKEGA